MIAREAKKSYVLAGEASFFVEKGCPEMLEGFPEEVICTPTASTVHFGGHFFLLSGGSHKLPGISFLRLDQARLFSLVSEPCIVLAPACRGVGGRDLASFIVLSMAPKGWTPISAHSLFRLL